MSVRDRERRALDEEASGAVPSVVESEKGSVAERIGLLARTIFAEGPPVRFRFWDGSALGPTTDIGAVVIRSPRALTRLIWSPDEVGIARAFILGDIELEGDAFALLRELHAGVSMKRRLGPSAFASGLMAAWRLGALGRPPERPAEEVRLGGWRHSQRRDAAAIAHHYDVGNDFYRLVLGPAMTYSCARFEEPLFGLEQAQASKHDLVCRKLGLHERPNARLLDVGCGWGAMAMHAASIYGARVVGITLSEQQVERARARVHESGLDDLVEIRLQDYRELSDERFDAISSIGMFEHVGAKRMDEYFDTLVSLLVPTGRLLNHAISTPGGSKLHGRTFINRYVFPDGELIDVAEVVGGMERAGFEVRDVESLREHYSQTLHAWVDNLENSWDEAVHLVGEARARIWRLYMAASANGFDDGGLSIHQVLGVLPGDGGTSGMPRTRAGWQ